MDIITFVDLISLRIYEMKALLKVLMMPRNYSYSSISQSVTDLKDFIFFASLVSL
jgi:hypothetical protein